MKIVCTPTLPNATANLYALLIMKFPFGEYAHTIQLAGNHVLKGILNMAEVQGLMRSDTIASNGTSTGLEVTVKVDGLCNHLSFKILRESSLPTCHLYPF